MDEFGKDPLTEGSEDEAIAADPGMEIAPIPVPLGDEVVTGPAGPAPPEPRAAETEAPDGPTPTFLASRTGAIPPPPEAESPAAPEDTATVESPAAPEGTAPEDSPEDTATAESPAAPEDTAPAESPAAPEDTAPEDTAPEDTAPADTAPADTAAESPAAPEVAADVIPGRRRFRPGRKTAIGVAAVLLLTVLGAAGIAYATYDYARDYEDRILPGAAIAGVDVGGLGRDEAIEAVRSAIQPELEREVTLSWEDKTWVVTPEELGAKSDARAAVDAAFAASGDATFIDKARMRLLGDELGFERDVVIRYPRKGIKGFVAGIASSFDRDARDASLDYSTGWVEVVDARRGRRIKVAPTVAALREALETGGRQAAVEVAVVEPEVTSDTFEQVLLVHIGDNKLYLYEDGKITKEWAVATGEPNYMTPTGLFEVTEKRYLPTWVNPAPTTWGADMPASIGPGPGNPLGLRAINWSAPAIRFHGTSALYSLGYNASHGCVRMANADVIELYDIIEVGTPIVSVVHGSLRPLYSSAPPSTPIAEQSADSTADAQSAETERGTAGKKKGED